MRDDTLDLALGNKHTPADVHAAHVAAIDEAPHGPRGDVQADGGLLNVVELVGHHLLAPAHACQRKPGPVVATTRNVMYAVVASVLLLDVLVRPGEVKVMAETSRRMACGATRAGTRTRLFCGWR